MDLLYLTFQGMLNINKKLKSAGKSVIKRALIGDIVFALSAQIYHIFVPVDPKQKEKIDYALDQINASMASKLQQSQAIVADFLRTNGVGANNMQSCFPDHNSFVCFRHMLEEDKRSNSIKERYYGYLLALYCELDSPKLSTSRSCLSPFIKAGRAHTTTGTIYFNGKRPTDKTFITELSHHVQFRLATRIDVRCILDIWRAYHTPTNRYNKMVYDISLDHALYTDSTSFEFEAHSLIDPLLHKYLFQNIEKSLSEDVAYIDAVKRDIHDHAVTIASIAKKRPDAKIPAGIWSFEQIYGKYRFISYLPSSHPLRIYLSDELKNLYLRDFYILCKYNKPGYGMFLMGNISSFADFGDFFNLTAEEKKEMIKSLKYLSDHL